jgi:plasmid stabilization system protein ParE
VKLVVTPRARRDLEMLIDWVAERAPVAARRASDQIYASFRRLLEHPASAPAIDDRRREAVVSFGRDGFVIRYRIIGDFLVIERVYHGLQDRS